MSSHMLMQFVDALFLSWYSADAVAAAVPAGMASWLLVCAFHGTAGFTSTLVAQYAGAGRAERAVSTVWQGIYFSLVSGAVVASCALFARPMFTLVGHAPAVRELEITYFAILCGCAPLLILSSALTGYYVGLHRTMVVFAAQCAGAVVNLLADWVLIFGTYGLPRMGITGAALGVVLGQTAIVAVLALCFFQSAPHQGKHPWKTRGYDADLMRRLIRFGFPNGMRYLVEMIAWTAFLFFVGRLGTVELTATNIAWRINGIAFFPIIGLSMAVGILVGNAQGGKDPDESVRVTVKGLILSEAWMIAAAAVFVLTPGRLYGLFYNPQTMSAAHFSELAAFGVILLRFVALYCLLDAFNIVLLSTLQSAGDTRWTFTVGALAHIVFIAALVWADMTRAGLYPEWIIATVFVMAQALVWLVRFLSGRWKHIEVIEAAD